MKIQKFCHSFRAANFNIRPTSRSWATQIPGMKEWIQSPKSLGKWKWNCANPDWGDRRQLPQDQRRGWGQLLILLNQPESTKCQTYWWEYQPTRISSQEDDAVSEPSHVHLLTNATDPLLISTKRLTDAHLVCKPCKARGDLHGDGEAHNGRADVEALQHPTSCAG